MPVSFDLSGIFFVAFLCFFCFFVFFFCVFFFRGDKSKYWGTMHEQLCKWMPCMNARIRMYGCGIFIDSNDFGY